VATRSRGLPGISVERLPGGLAESAARRRFQAVAPELDPHFRELFRGLLDAREGGSIYPGILLENPGELIGFHRWSLLLF